jgi:metal-sulfur cluster biosynthetic enzyme
VILNGDAQVHALDEAHVRQLINQISDPCSLARGVPIGLDDMGLVCDVQIQTTTAGPVIDLLLRLTSPNCLFFTEFECKVDHVLREAGAQAVNVRWDTKFDWTPDQIDPAAQDRLTKNRTERRRLISLAQSSL